MYMSELLQDADFEAGGKLTGDDTIYAPRLLPKGMFSVHTPPDNPARNGYTGRLVQGWQRRIFRLYPLRFDGYYVRRQRYTRGGYVLARAADCAYALQFVGCPYVYGGSSPATGFDCSGFAYYIYGKFDYGLLRTASQQYRSNGVSVSKSQLLPGDLVFFSSNGGRSVTHVGIYVGGSRFVHASTWSTGVIISDLTSSYYIDAYYGAKRIV